MPIVLRANQRNKKRRKEIPEKMWERKGAAKDLFVEIARGR
jgi:hypothetical protein